MQSKTRKWIVLGDIHQETRNLARIPELADAEGIIVTGDLTQNGGKGDARVVLEALRETGLPVLAQIGNMDLPEVDGWLSEQGINLHGRVHELAPGVALLGIGGSTITPFNTPSEFAEEQYSAWLKMEAEASRGYPLRILVSHNPPKGTVCDDIGGGVHVGSQAVRDFIEAEQPVLCLCGHIHEGVGEDRIGKTVVMNPGTLASGGYIVLELQDGQVKSRLHRGGQQ